MSQPGLSVIRTGTIFTRLRESGHVARVFTNPSPGFSLGFPLRRVEIIMVHRVSEESVLSPTPKQRETFR